MIPSIVVIIILLFVGCRDHHETGSYQDKDAKSQLLQNLAAWRQDSTSCMGIRLKLIEKGFLQQLSLEGLTRKALIDQLGNPNKSRSTTNPYEAQPKEYLEFMYYTDAICKDSSIDAIAWLMVTIDSKTDIVIKTMGGAN
jgi:hypothetical protein